MSEFDPIPPPESADRAGDYLSQHSLWAIAGTQTACCQDCGWQIDARASSARMSAFVREHVEATGHEVFTIRQQVRRTKASGVRQLGRPFDPDANVAGIRAKWEKILRPAAPQQRVTYTTRAKISPERVAAAHARIQARRRAEATAKPKVTPTH